MEEFAFQGGDQSSASSESDENIANSVPVLPARKSSKSKRTTPVWKPLSGSAKNSEVPFFNGSTNVFEDSLLNPIQYFAKHWTNAMTDLAVSESNLFASQNNAILATTRVEMNKFLGILIKMGLIGLPRIRLYWAEGYYIACHVSLVVCQEIDF